MDYLLGAALGGLVAFGYSIPAIIFELVERGKTNLAPPVIEVSTIFGRKLHKNEAFSAGLLLHICAGMVFGSSYVLFVELGWERFLHHPYAFDSFVLYGFLTWIIAGFITYPILQMGFFGRREGKHIWMETLASHMLLGVTMAALVHWFQPFFFMGR